MEEQLKTIVQAIDRKKGENVIVYEYHHLNPLIDYAIIAEASNLRQVHALAQHVVEEAHKAGILVKRVEGDKESAWVLVDLDTIIVHIFLNEERQIYRLEQLYADLPQVAWEE